MTDKIIQIEVSTNDFCLHMPYDGQFAYQTDIFSYPKKTQIICIQKKVYFRYFFHIQFQNTQCFIKLMMSFESIIYLHYLSVIYL